MSYTNTAGFGGRLAPTSTVRELRWPSGQVQDRQIMTQPQRVPGMRWMVVSLYVTWLVGCRQVFYHWGIPLPLRFTSQVGNSLALLLFVFGATRYLRLSSTRRLWQSSHFKRVCLWLCMVPALGLYGSLAFGNAWNTIGIEALSLIYMGLFALLGVDDRFWHAIDGHLTILFYLTATGIFLYYDVPMVQVLDEGSSEQIGDFSRYSFTIGSTLRPLLGPGVLLGIWGLIRRDTRLWKCMQIPAPFVFFAIEGGIFKFRSTAVFVLLAFLGFLVLRPLLEHRARVGTAILLVLLSVAAGQYFMTTESGAVLERRAFEDTQGEGLLDVRRSELQAYVSDLGLQVLIGRGLGGSFDAISVFHREAASRWTTLHFGVFVFSLKGGLALFATFVSFVLPGLRFRSASWYQNPCNLSAALLLPAYAVLICLDPFNMAPEGLMFDLPLMMILSRFGRRENLDVGVVSPQSRWKQIEAGVRGDR